MDNKLGFDQFGRYVSGIQAALCYYYDFISEDWLSCESKITDWISNRAKDGFSRKSFSVMAGWPDSVAYPYNCSAILMEFQSRTSELHFSVSFWLWWFYWMTSCWFAFPKNQKNILSRRIRNTRYRRADFRGFLFPLGRFLLTNFTHIKKKRIFTLSYTKSRFKKLKE